MERPQNIIVRGRCECGKRYRIRNAQAGVTVLCPNCGRLIPITGADLQIAAANERIIPLKAETVEPLEAIPIECGQLSLAPEGSRPGLTGNQRFSHVDAILNRALQGNRSFGATYDDRIPVPSRNQSPVLVEFEPGVRGFLYDLLASFYCAGIINNALNILLIATACTIVVSMKYLWALMGFSFGLSNLSMLSLIFVLIMIPLYAVVVLYAIQFYWNVLRCTAGDEDAIPWAQSDWSLWYDGVIPLFWMLVISALCLVPYGVLLYFGPPTLTSDPLAGWIVLGIGWFFWPVAVMSVALGDSILFVRPDWLIRCILGIGPVYLVAWLTVMLAVAGWAVFLLFWQIWFWIPILGFAVNLYLGYVVFRTLGLLFRHFRGRFPWKY